MKKQIVALLTCLAMLCTVLPMALAETAESELKVYSSALIGRWSLNVADYPGFAEEGLTEGTITLEFREDGTASTWYEGMLTSTYAYVVFMNYYVAVLPDGTAETSLFEFAEDGSSFTLADMNNEWELTYNKVAE